LLESYRIRFVFERRPVAKKQNVHGRQTVNQGSAARRAAVLALSPNVSLV